MAPEQAVDQLLAELAPAILTQIRAAQQTIGGYYATLDAPAAEHEARRVLAQLLIVLRRDPRDSAALTAHLATILESVSVPRKARARLIAAITAPLVALLQATLPDRPAQYHILLERMRTARDIWDKLVAAPGPAEGPGRRGGTTLVVLVITGNAVWREACINLLLDTGYAVLTVRDAPTARWLLPTYQPAGIILGPDVPGTDGTDLLSHLRGGDDTRATPVVWVAPPALPGAPGPLGVVDAPNGWPDLLTTLARLTAS